MKEALRFLARNFVDEPSRRPFFLERDLDDFARLVRVAESYKELFF